MNIKKLVGGREKLNRLMKLFCVIPDKAYLKLMFRFRTGKKLNLKNPTTFNEKLQWLKLYDRCPEYTTMVDKCDAKKYVASAIGEQYIIPTLGVWEQFDDIDFDKLPKQFVLKCTHDSGGLIVCKDKDKLNKEEARKKIEQSLKCNFYWVAREWPYKNVKPRIIAEQYMEDSGVDGLTDYKFYCFNGEPRFLYVSQGLENHATARISFLTLDWQFAPYERSDYKPFETLPEKPRDFDKMVSLAKELSKGQCFLRVDLYQIGEQVYFSELTFSPSGGFMPFREEAHNIALGEMIELPKQVSKA